MTPKQRRPKNGIITADGYALNDEVIRIDVTIEITALDGGTVNQEEKYLMQGNYGPMKKSEIFPSREELLKSL